MKPRTGVGAAMAPVALGMSDRDPGPRAVQAIVDVVALPRVPPR